MSRDRLLGAGLFLFIPLVLVLYLRYPFGLAPSLAVGVALMLGHRFVARPFMDRTLSRRCFWCGRDLDGEDRAAPFRSRGKTIPARGCSEDHAAYVLTFARSVNWAFLPLRLAIVLPVLVYLALAVLAAAGRPLIPMAWAVWVFKLPIAAAVVALSFLWPRGARLDVEPAIDFPPHNLFLLGVRTTLWIFRVVGLIWLAQATWLAVRLVVRG